MQFKRIWMGGTWEFLAKGCSPSFSLRNLTFLQFDDDDNNGLAIGLVHIEGVRGVRFEICRPTMHMLLLYQGSKPFWAFLGFSPAAAVCVCICVLCPVCTLPKYFEINQAFVVPNKLTTLSFAWGSQIVSTFKEGAASLCHD